MLPRPVRGAVALALVALGALALQSIHMVEHITQVLQYYYLHVPAHGLLGEVLDREWVHLAYNGSLEVALIGILLGYGLYRPLGSGGHMVAGQYLFLGLVVLQGYHVFEHVVKIMQYLATGKEDTPGILGQFFPTILVHFTLNAIVLAMMVLAYYRLGSAQRAWMDLRPRTSRRGRADISKPAPGNPLRSAEDANRP